MRLACLLADLPVEMLGRLRCDRVLHFPAPPRQPGTRAGPAGTAGSSPSPTRRPGRRPPVTTTTATTRYGTAVAQAWDRLHPRLTHRSAWLDHDGPLPVIEGTLIRLQVDHLPGDRDPKPVWLWCSATGAPPADVDRLWQAFLRRFDLEHTFRLFKQVLGLDRPEDPRPRRRGPLDLADHHRPYPAPPRPAARCGPAPALGTPRPAGRLTPARVRRGFRNIRATLPCLAGAPKPGKPGPGRPPGSKNRRPAPRYDVGKTTKREPTLKARRERAG